MIYEVCIELRTDRGFRDLSVEYSAEALYNIEHSATKIPENLLNKEDFKVLYQRSQFIEATVKSYRALQSERNTHADQSFD